MIDGGGVLSALDPSTKLVPDWTTLQLLHDLGRAAAADWLEGVPAPALRNAAAHEGTSGELQLRQDRRQHEGVRYGGNEPYDRRG